MKNLHSIQFDGDSDTHGIRGRMTSFGTFRPAKGQRTLCRIDCSPLHSQTVVIGPAADINCVQCLIAIAGPAPVERVALRKPELAGV